MQLSPWLVVAALCLTVSVPVIHAEPDPEPAAANQELLDRTLAMVGGQPITLSDARAAIALGLIVVPDAADQMSDATRQLVDRELILREVQRYAPAAPGETAIDARLGEIRQRYAAGTLTGVLDRYGFTEARLRAWVRDDLRTQAYLAQRFASASLPSDAEIAQAYTRSRAEFDTAGRTFEQATPILRERLIASRRRELITDWLSDLRRRTDIVISQR
jgi:hypothetical protein